MDDQDKPFLLSRADVDPSISDSKGWSVTNALSVFVGDYGVLSLASLLWEMNETQRSLLALGQVRSWVPFCGLREAVDVLGAEVLLIAAKGSAVAGSTEAERLLRRAVEDHARGETLGWEQLEHALSEVWWDLQPFIEEHAEDLFVE